MAWTDYERADVLAAITKLVGGREYSLIGLTTGTPVVRMVDRSEPPSLGAIEAEIAAAVAPLRAAQRIASTKLAVIAFADSLAAQITGPIPTAEKDGWDAKARAAITYLAAVDGGDTHDIAVAKVDPVGRILIDAEAPRTGEAWADICAQIKAQAEFYALASGTIAAARRTTMAAINALGPSATQEQLDAVVASAKATAEAEFAAIMALAPA